MRTIKKRAQPTELTEWRALRLVIRPQPGMECTYASLRQSPETIKAIAGGLVAEQGGICAYTGHHIDDFHIEHLTPQSYCLPGEDTDYENLVACWPAPNQRFEPAYGAKKKGGWPAQNERASFVSPLRPDCSSRFKFNHQGEIVPANPADEAARETIKKLALDHKSLTALRRQAIQGALNPPNRRLKLVEVQSLLRAILSDSARLDAGEPVKLRPFCFAMVSSLEREIKKLKAILGRC